MPIRVNLLAEAQAAEDLRRRDPVKRAIYIGTFLFVLTLAWWSSLQLEAMRAKKDLSLVQTEIRSHTNEFSSVTVGLKKISGIQEKLDQLQKLSTARFLQGNLLNALQQLAFPNIQITRIRSAQSYELTDAKPAPNVTEKIIVSLDVRDSSANPGDQVNKFKDLVAKQPYFQSFLNKTNGVRLSNLSAPQIGLDGKPYVLFTLECQYNDQTR
jgi:hypothetical protein